jgi:hypothetical protein
MKPSNHQSLLGMIAIATVLVAASNASAAGPDDLPVDRIGSAIEKHVRDAQADIDFRLEKAGQAVAALVNAIEDLWGEIPGATEQALDFVQNERDHAVCLVTQAAHAIFDERITTCFP